MPAELVNVTCTRHSSVNPQVPGEPSYLLYGDENGDVHVLTFVNPCTHLFAVDTRKSSGVTPRISYNVSVKCRFACTCT